MSLFSPVHVFGIDFQYISIGITKFVSEPRTEQGKIGQMNEFVPG